MPLSLSDPDVQQRLGIYRPVIDRVLFGLGLLGILVVVHLWIQTGRGFDRGCLGFSAPTTTVECNEVVQSEAGQLWGVSNVVWGLLYYLAIVGLSFAVAVVPASLLPRVKGIRALLILFGFLYSGYLVLYQATQLGQYCVLCLMSASIAALLFMVQTIDFVKPAGKTLTAMKSGKTTREPLLYVMMAALVMVLAGADVMHFRSIDETPAQIAECQYDAEMTPFQDYEQLVNFSDPFQGNASAPVVVIEYFDPNCPHCKVMHPLMQEVVEKYGEKARFYELPFVLWRYSVPQSQAMLIAAQENKYYEMLEGQFARQKAGGLSIEELQEVAQEIGIDPVKLKMAIERGEGTDRLQEIREAGSKLGMTSVPAVMINGRFVTSGSRTVDCLGKLITEAGS